MVKKRVKTQLISKIPEPVKKHFDFSDRAADINCRKTWMWLGVSVVLATIIFFWLWSLKINFSSFSWQNSKEHEMVNNIKNNWKETFSETKPALNEEEKILVQNKLKSIISQTISSNPATGTTTTSTISTPSTTH